MHRDVVVKEVVIHRQETRRDAATRTTCQPRRASRWRYVGRHKSQAHVAAAAGAAWSGLQAGWVTGTQMTELAGPSPLSMFHVQTQAELELTLTSMPTRAPSRDA